MASVNIGHNRSGQVVDRAGADPNQATYDPATTTLTCPDVDQPTLDAARDDVANRTGNARPKDKQDHRQEMRRKALRAHDQAVLAADPIFQQILIDINNANTLADLDGIDYP